MEGRKGRRRRRKRKRRTSYNDTDEDDISSSESSSDYDPPPRPRRNGIRQNGGLSRIGVPPPPPPPPHIPNQTVTVLYHHHLSFNPYDFTNQIEHDRTPPNFRNLPISSLKATKTTTTSNQLIRANRPYPMAITRRSHQNSLQQRFCQPTIRRTTIMNTKKAKKKPSSKVMMFPNNSSLPFLKKKSRMVRVIQVFGKVYNEKQLELRLHRKKYPWFVQKGVVLENVYDGWSIVLIPLIRSFDQKLDPSDCLRIKILISMVGKISLSKKDGLKVQIFDEEIPVTVTVFKPKKKVTVFRKRKKKGSEEKCEERNPSTRFIYGGNVLEVKYCLNAIPRTHGAIYKICFRVESLVEGREDDCLLSRPVGYYFKKDNRKEASLHSLICNKRMKLLSFEDEDEDDDEEEEEEEGEEEEEEENETSKTSRKRKRKEKNDEGVEQILKRRKKRQPFRNVSPPTPEEEEEEEEEEEDVLDDDEGVIDHSPPSEIVGEEENFGMGSDEPEEEVFVRRDNDLINLNIEKQQQQQLQQQQQNDDKISTNIEFVNETSPLYVSAHLEEAAERLGIFDIGEPKDLSSKQQLLQPPPQQQQQKERKFSDDDGEEEDRIKKIFGVEGMLEYGDW